MTLYNDSLITEGGIMYITITGINQYMGSDSLKIGQKLLLYKDHDNVYDDESIVAKGETGTKYGYVANSVDSVARGSHSAGYIYTFFDEKAECTIRFIFENKAIAEIEKIKNNK